MTEALTEDQASDEDSSSNADEDDEEYKPDTETRGRRP
jgi:hypothetical protein